MRSFRVPNEVLFRLHDPTGPGAPVAVKGAHITFNVWTYEDDGTFVSAAQGLPESIAVGAQKGFPLEEVLNGALAAALLDRDNAHAALEARTAEREQAAKELADALKVAKKHADLAAAATERAASAEAQLADAMEANRRGVAVVAEVVELGT